MVKVRAEIQGTECEITGYPYSVYGNGIDSVIDENGNLEYIKTGTLIIITDEFSPFKRGQYDWDLYVLYNQKRTIPYKEGTDEFFEYQRGWNYNFNGISKKELAKIKKDNLIFIYRSFIQSLLNNDCIKGVGTIQTAKELVRKFTDR